MGIEVSLQNAGIACADFRGFDFSMIVNMSICLFLLSSILNQEMQIRKKYSKKEFNKQSVFPTEFI